MIASPHARSWWIRAGLTAGVLAFLLRRVEIADAGQALLRLDARSAIVVLALVGLDRAVMIWRWVVLLRATGAGVSASAAARMYLVSSFVGSFLPAGIGADATRVYTLSRQTARPGAAVASVAVDRLFGLASIVAIGLAGVIISGDRTGVDGQPAVLIAALLVITGSALFLFADYWIRAAMPRPWHDSKAGGRLLRLADALSEYRGHHSALAGVAALSLAVQMLRILQAYLLGRGIGIGVDFSYYLLFMPVGLIALMLPISISGFGAPQGIIVWLLDPVSVPRADSFALSTLIVLTGILANLPGGWLYLVRRRA